MGIINGSAPAVMWLTLIIFNVAIIALLKYSCNNIELKDVLREKAVPAAPPAPAAAPPAGGAPQENTSYSRVTGLIGAIILATFFWALGNVVIYKSFVNVSDVKELLSNMGGYITSGAALFAPYAVNKLTNVFKS